MKKDMPLEGLRWSRDSGSALYDTPQTAVLGRAGGGAPKHIINLVSGVNKDNVYEFDLRHNAQGDIRGRIGDALIAFNLNSLWKEQPEKVKIKLNWLSFSGKKSVELSLKMHPNSSISNTDVQLISHHVE